MFALEAGSWPPLRRQKFPELASGNQVVVLPECNRLRLFVQLVATVCAERMPGLSEVVGSVIAFPEANAR